MNKKIMFLAVMYTGSLFSWISVSGPLQLADTVDGSGKVVTRGVIMKKIFTHQALHKDLVALIEHFKVDERESLPSYQTILNKIRSTNSEMSQAEINRFIEMFEHAIMYVYDDCIYLIGGYNKYCSLIVSGFRWRALNPFSYANPFSWVSENHEKASQLIAELDQLADLASKKASLCISMRLKSTVFAYRHWFKVRIAGVACLGAFMSMAVVAHYCQQASLS